MDETTENGLLTKEGLAKAFGVSLTTIGAWIRKGCPYVEDGGNGKPWKFRLSDVAHWREHKARGSGQHWRGGHVRLGERHPNPVLDSLLKERPDLENGIRFFTEDAIGSFLSYWMCEGYPKAILYDLYAATGSKVVAAQLLKIIAVHLLGGAGSWVLDDVYNKAAGGQLDETWGAITGRPVNTEPPAIPSGMLLTANMPDWFDWTTEEMAARMFNEGGEKPNHTTATMETG